MRVHLYRGDREKPGSAVKHTRVMPPASTIWRCSMTTKVNTRRPSPFTNGRWRSGKRPWARSTPTWPPASTIWRGSTTTKVNTRRPNPFTNVRWQSMKSPGPGAPRRGHQPQQSGVALPQPRSIREGRAPLPTNVGDLRKGLR
jgi:hypothetical protein